MNVFSLIAMIDRDFEEMGLAFVEQEQSPARKRNKALKRTEVLFFEKYGYKMPSHFEKKTDKQIENIRECFRAACQEVDYQFDILYFQPFSKEPIITGICLWNLHF